MAIDPLPTQWFPVVSTPVAFVETDFGIDLLGRTCRPEILEIEPCIGVQEQAVRPDVGLIEHCGDHLELHFDIGKVVVVPRHGLRHGHQGQPLSVGQVEYIGGLWPLAPLVFHGHAAAFGKGMCCAISISMASLSSTLYMGYGIYVLRHKCS